MVEVFDKTNMNTMEEAEERVEILVHNKTKFVPLITFRISTHKTPKYKRSKNILSRLTVWRLTTHIWVVAHR